MVDGNRERTFVMIKPDVVANNRIGAVLDVIESHPPFTEGVPRLRPVAMRMLQLSNYEAERFYAEHRTKIFFPELIRFMTSACVVVMILEGSEAVRRFRELLGATDSKMAAEGTLRHRFGSDPVYRNAVHGSDSAESAKREMAMFFRELSL